MVIRKPEWILFALRSLFRPEAAVGVHETCELRLPDGTFHATVDDGVLTTGMGAGPNPHLVLIGERSTVLAALMGELATREAAQRGKLKIQGGPESPRTLPRHVQVS